jgi:hypothetical protein
MANQNYSNLDSAQSLAWSRFSPQSIVRNVSAIASEISYTKMSRLRRKRRADVYRTCVDSMCHRFLAKQGISL